MIEIAYNQEYHDKLAYRICAETGASNKALCKIFGLSVRQDLDRWYNLYPSLKEAVKAGRDFYYAERIEHSLVRRAMGYDYTETETGSRDGKPIEVKRRKHVPPDVEAIKTYLRYRSPARWKEQEQTTDPILSKIFAMILDKTRSLPGTKTIDTQFEITDGGDQEGTQATEESPDTLYTESH